MTVILEFIRTRTCTEEHCGKVDIATRLRCRKLPKAHEFKLGLGHQTTGMLSVNPAVYGYLI